MYFLLVNRTCWVFPTLEALCFIPTPACLYGPKWISEPARVSTAGTTSALRCYLHLFLVWLAADWNISSLICSCCPQQSRRTWWMMLTLTAVRTSHKQGDNSDLILNGVTAALKCPCMRWTHSQLHTWKALLWMSKWELRVNLHFGKVCIFLKMWRMVESLFWWNLFYFNKMLLSL